MKIYVVSNIKNIEKSFTGLSKSKKHMLQIVPVSELKKTITGISRSSFIYLDVSSLGRKEIPKTINLLAKLDGSYYGVIDPKGRIADIAELFHRFCASDYIDAAILKKGLLSKRIDHIMKFRQIEDPDERNRWLKKKYILSGCDWKNICEGDEYTFCLMFIELDGKAKLKGLISPEQFTAITGSFRGYVEETVAPMKGRIWIWLDFGGLVLFPFDGRKSEAFVAAFRLMINRKLMSAEFIPLDISLSYRIALHIGNTLYRSKGETGTIVADSLNTVFHLGQKYAEPGCFYITEDILPFTPSGLTDYFIPAGEYEGRNILRMRRII
jgi:hypothetical protein